MTDIIEVVMKVMCSLIHSPLYNDYVITILQSRRISAGDCFIASFDGGLSETALERRHRLPIRKKRINGNPPDLTAPARDACK